MALNHQQFNLFFITSLGLPLDDASCSSITCGQFSLQSCVAMIIVSSPRIDPLASVFILNALEGMDDEDVSQDLQQDFLEAIRSKLFASV
jgi:hypothetical protein